MNKKSKSIQEIHSGQFQYLGTWVDKNTFRAFVYDKEGNQKLADSYTEFEELTSSGIWFAKKQDVLKNIRNKKDAVCSAS